MKTIRTVNLATGRLETRIIDDRPFLVRLVSWFADKEQAIKNVAPAIDKAMRDI